MKNRTGIVILIDIFIILVFVIAIRNVEKKAEFQITENNKFGIQHGLVIAKKTGLGQNDWNIWDDDKWRSINEKDSWLGELIATSCPEICKKYGISDTQKGAIFIIGSLAKKTGLLFLNKCKISNASCRTIRFKISNNKVTASLNE